MTLRATGEHARAADTAGGRREPGSVLGFIFSCICAGLAGAFLSIGYVGAFISNISQGRGYIAIAIIILGQWRPLGMLAAAAVFGRRSGAGGAVDGQHAGASERGDPGSANVLALLVVAFFGKAKAGRRRTPLSAGRRVGPRPLALLQGKESTR